MASQEPQESSAETAQRAAITEVRVRYERGELPFEAFRRALDALLLAQTPEECEIILHELPAAPLAPLRALEPATPRAMEAPAHATGPGWRWIVAILGETKKLRRPWQLAQKTLATALVGEVTLDLTLAALPAQATLQVAAIVGEVTIYVPRSAHVSVRGLALVGEVEALGEHCAGILSFGQEEHVPDVSPEARLTISALALVGQVRVVVVDGPVLGTARAATPRLLPQAE
jgi:hypothetical protein